MLINLAVVGSRAYANAPRIGRVLEAYRARYEIVIVSGGCPTGADALAKALALAAGLPYIEFPPAHRPHNEFCRKPAACYNKPYRVANYFDRNGEIAEFCDHLAAFVASGVRAAGTMDAVRKARAAGKVVNVFED